MAEAARISVGELFELLADENTTPENIKPFFQLDERQSSAFNPVVAIDQNKVDVGGKEAAVAMASFNNGARRYRKRLYDRRLEAGWVGPVILSEGDSWFQYPILLDDVIDNFIKDHAVLSLGAAGDLLAAIVDSGELVNSYDPTVHDFVLLSCGGNDLLGDGRLAIFVQEFSKSRDPKNYLNEHFPPFLKQAKDGVRGLVEALRVKSKDVRIITHSYAYAIPNHGKWLGRPLEKKGITNPKLQRMIVAQIVDHYHNALLKIAGMYPQNLLIADCRTFLPSADLWNDELHPTDAGYKIIFNQILKTTKAAF